MKHNLALTIASFLSILLLTIHLADDIVLGIEKGTVANLAAVPIVVVWLYGTLMLAERRSGYVIVMLGSLLGAFVPWIHFSGPRGVVGPRVAAFAGARLFVFTLLAVGATSLFSLVLSAQGLWRLRGGRK